MLLVAAFALGALLDFRPCPDFEGDDLAQLRTLNADAAALDAGGELCLSLSAVPSRWAKAWGLHVRSLVHDAEFEDVCALGGAACPAAANRTLLARACARNPLETLVLSGDRATLDVTLRFDADGDAAGCYETRLEIGSSLALDEAAEKSAAEARVPLRRVLMQGSAASEADVLAVDSLLRQSYASQPEWEAAFRRWRVVHKKQFDTPSDEATAFQNFRDNVLAAHRAGRPVQTDAHSHLHPDARRTISHFA